MVCVEHCVLQKKTANKVTKKDFAVINFEILSSYLWKKIMKPELFIKAYNIYHKQGHIVKAKKRK